MSKKKTVKAPLTYNPGKGRPKEHLAYLNWQEMQALKRLNGNNQEQGPKGLPSFPPADARSGSYNSGYGSASRSTPSRAAATPSRTTRTSRTSGPSGNLSAPVRTAPSASAYGRTTTTTRSGGTPSAAPRSISGIGSPSRGVTPSYSRGVTTPSAQRAASGVGSPVDRAVKQAVETRSISSAQKTPALAQDRSKVSGGYKLSDITGTNVPGGKVTGAIQSVKDLGIAGVPGAGNRVGVPSATVTNQYVPKPIPRPGSEGQIGKYKYSGLLSSTPSNAEIADMIREEAAARGIDPSVAKKVAVFEGLNRLTKPEEGWQSKVVKKGKRETSYGPYQLRVGGGLGDKFQKITGLNITDPKSVKAQVQFALDEAAKGGWGPWYGAKAAGLSKKSGLSEAKPIYGGSEARSIPKEKTIGGVKSLGISPSPEKVRAIVPASSTPERAAVPGLIQYPRLDRPIPPSAGRSAVPPTVRTPKQITDRVLAEPAYRPYDIRVTSPPAPPLQRKEIYDRIAPEAGAPPVRIGGDMNMLAGAGAFPSVGTTISPRGIGVSGGISGSAGYSQDVVRDIYAGSVSPPRFRSATEVASRFPAPIRPAGSIGGIAGLQAATEGVSSPIAGASTSAVANGIPGVIGSAEGQFQMPRIGGAIGGTLGVSSQGRVSVPVSEIYDAGMPKEYKEKYGIDEERVLEVENVPETFPPSQQEGPPSQDVTISPKAEEAQGKARKTANAARKGAQILLNLGFPGAGTVAGQGFKYLDAQVQKLVDAYQVSGPTERLAMEKKYPNLIPRAISMGITPQSDYGDYLAWAEKSGLRSPPTKEGGGRDSIGIASLGGGISGGGSPSSGEQPASSVKRPDIYYMWDLGVNIPSPSDPNYTQYQTYLIDRAASHRAMGWA